MLVDKNPRPLEKTNKDVPHLVLIPLVEDKGNFPLVSFGMTWVC